MNFDIFEGEGEAGAEFRRRTGYAIPRQVSELYVTRNPSSAAPFAVKSIEGIDGVLFSWARSGAIFCRFQPRGWGCEQLGLSEMVSGGFFGSERWVQVDLVLPGTGFED